MNVALLLYTLFIVTLYVLVEILLSGKILIVKNIAIGIALFLCTFMVISLITFALAVYSLYLVYSIMLLIALVTLSVTYITKYKKPETLKQIELVKYFPIPLAIVLLIGFLFTAQKFELFGMRGDKGAYQTNTLLMVEGLESNVVPIKEYNLMTNDEDRQLFLDNMRTQNFSDGFYPIFINDNRGTISPGAYPENSAIIHGLPNLPALLSITGLIFGAEYIMIGLTLPYLIAIILLFVTLNLNLGLSKYTSTIATLIFALSPVILWISKASLTEIYITMLVSMLCYYITSRESSASWLLWIPVSAFAFFHVSIYTVMPMFVILLIGLVLMKRDMGAWFSGVLTVILYGVGYIAMCFAAPWYTFFNYMRLFKVFNRFGLSFRADSSQFALVLPVCFIALCIFALLYYYSFHKKKTVPDIKKYIPNAVLVAVVICLGVLLYNWFKVANGVPTPTSTFTHFYGGGLVGTIPNINLFSFAFGSGFVLLILVMIQLFRRREFLFTKQTLPLTFMFLYCVIFINTTLNLFARDYYYATRYFAPYIVIIMICGGIIVDRIRLNGKIAVAAVSIGIMVPFSVTLAVNNDVSYMDIKSQREVMSSIRDFEPGSIIILEDYLELFLFNEVSYGSDSYAFPLSVYNQLTDKSFIEGRRMYYISTTTNNKDLSIFTQANAVHSEGRFLNNWLTGWQDGPIGLLRPANYEYWIRVEKVDKSEIVIKHINMSKTYTLLINNTNRFENNGEVDFMWSGPEATFEFIFDANEDYYFRVNHLPIFEDAGELELWFSFDTLQNMVHIVADSSTTGIEFRVPQEDLEGRNHVLHMFGDTWQPSELFGTDDERELGIAITSIEAIPASQRS